MFENQEVDGGEVKSLAGFTNKVANVEVGLSEVWGGRLSGGSS